ncbi:MAG: hypothetical protein GX227_06500 [Clostridiaceae bacterium]|nr:hypothetical protein [Clostridiaceae bacterium]
MKKTTIIPQGKVINITVDGYPVKIRFSDEFNPNISQQVKNALIDDYLRKSGLVLNPST